MPLSDKRRLFRPLAGENCRFSSARSYYKHILQTYISIYVHSCACVGFCNTGCAATVHVNKAGEEEEGKKKNLTQIISELTVTCRHFKAHVPTHTQNNRCAQSWMECAKILDRGNLPRIFSNKQNKISEKRNTVNMSKPEEGKRNGEVLKVYPCLPLHGFCFHLSWNCVVLFHLLPAAEAAAQKEATQYRIKKEDKGMTEHAMPISGRPGLVDAPLIHLKISG